MANDVLSTTAPCIDHLASSSFEIKAIARKPESLGVPKSISHLFSSLGDDLATSILKNLQSRLGVPTVRISEEAVVTIGTRTVIV